MTSTCLLCGYEGEDVAVLLEQSDEPRMVTVPTVSSDGRPVSVEVPERYYAVPRCTDRDACRERQWAAPPPGPVEDPSSWL